MELHNSVALITGAAKRVGRQTALHLAAHGVTIALHYRSSSEEAEQTLADIRDHGGRVEPFVCDLTAPNACDSLIEHVQQTFGRLDILVNNASIFKATPLESLSDRQWHDNFAIHATAPMQLCRAAWPIFKQQRRGKVVNIADIMADRPRGRFLAYCASKAALLNLTRSLAHAMAPHVQVNAIGPGAVLWPEDYDEATKQRILDHVPMRRAGSPQDIANAVLFLCRDGDYMTGQMLNVDGGRSIEFGSDIQ